MWILPKNIPSNSDSVLPVEFLTTSAKERNLKSNTFPSFTVLCEHRVIKGFCPQNPFRASLFASCYNLLPLLLCWIHTCWVVGHCLSQILNGHTSTPRLHPIHSSKKSPSRRMEKDALTLLWYQKHSSRMIRKQQPFKADVSIKIISRTKQKMQFISAMVLSCLVFEGLHLLDGSHHSFKVQTSRWLVPVWISALGCPDFANVADNTQAM